MLTAHPTLEGWRLELVAGWIRVHRAVSGAPTIPALRAWLAIVGVMEDHYLQPQYLQWARAQ